MENNDKKFHQGASGFNIIYCLTTVGQALIITFVTSLLSDVIRANITLTYFLSFFVIWFVREVRRTRLTHIYEKYCQEEK